MSWKITRNQTDYPLEILVDDTTIALIGSALDEALRDLVLGTKDICDGQKCLLRHNMTSRTSSINTRHTRSCTAIRLSTKSTKKSKNGWWCHDTD